MELREFVTATIVNICNGIKDAQEQVNSNGACVSPGIAKDTIARNPNDAYTPQYLDFDVAVTIIESTDNASTVNTKASISVLGITLSINGKNVETKGLSEMHISRIKFSVPVLYPMTSPKNQRNHACYTCDVSSHHDDY